MQTPAMTRDGFVWKKSRLIHGGSWERRYMRTERHMLVYFSEGLTKIQQSKIKDARAGGYRYRTVGVDPSEELDMREVIRSIDDIERVGADLNPLDYCLWADIERRMLATKKQGNESKAAYAKRLRRVALKTDRGTVRKAVQAPPSQTFSIGQCN